MNKLTKMFLTVIALLVITDTYAGVADGLDKIMNPQEPVTQKPNVKPKSKPLFHTHTNPSNAVTKKHQQNYDSKTSSKATPTIAVTVKDVSTSNTQSPSSTNSADTLNRLKNSWLK
ncbi:MAG: hypothetical protein QX189_01680 [Methylococcales bacterium]